MKRLRISTLALPLSVVLGACLWGCQEPPLANLQRARYALEAAQVAGAVRHSEPRYRAAEQLMEAGWMEMARQNGRLKPFRDYATADSVLALAFEAARIAEEEATTRARQLEEQARGDYALLEAELAAHRQALDGSLNMFHAERYWSQAALALRTGRHLMAQGEHAAASNKLNEGRQALIRVGQVLDQQRADEAQYVPMWRRWVEETVAESRRTGGYAVIVDKSRHTLYLLRGGKVIRQYRCDLGYNSARQKTYSGDGATPEGKYRITGEKGNGSSRYYKALPISFPNGQDIERHRHYKERGLISKWARIGGNIEIHGYGGRDEDWTEGCVALTNGDMDHLMRHVGTGTPVTIVRRSDQWP